MEILLTRKGAVLDGFRDPSGILIREKALVSLTQRNKQHGRTNQNLADDDVNIRFFDNIEKGRSLSRDRNDSSMDGAEQVTKDRHTGGGGGERGTSLPRGSGGTKNRELRSANKVTAVSLVGGPAVRLDSGHSETPTNPTQENSVDSNGKQCIFYLRGTCANGINCKYKHGDSPYLGRVPTNNESR